MSKRKRALDREAGLVFSWRTKASSHGRVLVAVLLSGGFWLFLLGLVRVMPMREAPQASGEFDLSVVDLNERQNRWLAEIVNREIPFPNRWDLLPEPDTEAWIEQALSESAPPRYRPQYPEVAMPDLSPEDDLRSILGRWPLPAAERIPAKAVAPAGPLAMRWRAESGGSPEKKNGAFSWPLEGKSGFSLGEHYRYYVAVDANGHVRSVLPLGVESTENRTRNAYLAERLRGENFSSRKAGGGNQGLDWLVLEGDVVEGSGR